MKNVLMLDLETTGSVPGCCILTIGASGLDKDGGSVEFYKRIAHYRSKSDGFLDEAKTLEWWEKQDESIRFEAFSGRDNPEEVINEFLGFIDENFSVTAKSFSVWCKGPDFDFPILKRYFERYGHEFPWAFWQQRDYRTIQAMSSLIKRHENNQGAHSALEDAKAQMRGLEYFWSLKQLDLLKELDTANRIKEEQIAKADKLLSCLKCLVMRDLIKDCPEKNSAIEIVNEAGK